MASTAKVAAAQNLGNDEGLRGEPTVSFVVLCYKLAHLLSECVNSILTQTYGDFEVLVMDDCSPDNTEEVAKSFQDHRIRYIRNENNLGFLCNENEGIRLSRGKYVWIISADDYLRKPYLLQRYVELMENHPNVGYAICAGVGVRDGRETGLVGPSKYRDRDEIVKGQLFLKTLLYANIVLAPSAMARRECYEKISLYPLDIMRNGKKIDMVWAADWYVWCLFALSYDVAYFAEPMVCYREHDLSMTSMITTKEKIDLCVEADLAVPWSVRQRAEKAGLKAVSRDCLRALGHEYGLHGNTKWYRGCKTSMSEGQFEDSLCRSTENESERNWIRSKFYAAKGDAANAAKDLAAARKFYVRSLQNNPLNVVVCGKLLLSLGMPGIYLRKGLRFFLGLRG